MESHETLHGVQDIVKALQNILTVLQDMNKSYTSNTVNIVNTKDMSNEEIIAAVKPKKQVKETKENI